MVTAAPLVPVTQARHHSGRGSALGPDTWRRTHWYELQLECGHTVERSARYNPATRGQRQPGARRVSDVLPPPERARCYECVKATT